MEWAQHKLRVPVGPLPEQRYFLLDDCVRFGADVSRGKRRSWLGTSSRRNREQQEWNLGLDLGSHVDSHGAHADNYLYVDVDVDVDLYLNFNSNFNLNFNNDDYNAVNDNDYHHAILGLQPLRQPRERDGTDSDQRGSSWANRLSAWWHLHSVVF